jgi:hypothetical protein
MSPPHLMTCGSDRLDLGRSILNSLYPIRLGSYPSAYHDLDEAIVSVPLVENLESKDKPRFTHSAPAFNSSLVALKTAGTPSATRPKLAECPPQQPAPFSPPEMAGEKSPCPPV